jgi:hypothetical protein
VYRKVTLDILNVKIDIQRSQQQKMVQDREKAMGLRYGDVEAALAEAMTIPPDGMKAFRARLRHLRNIGIPSELPEPGKGVAIRYTYRHAFEMFIALQMENIGHAPKRAAHIAQEIIKQKDLLKNLQSSHLYVVVYTTKENSETLSLVFCPEIRLIYEELENSKLHMNLAFTLLNLGEAESLIRGALDRAIYI